MTVRYDILTALKGILEGITIANGYLTDVETVEIGLKDFAEVKASVMPWIGIGFGDALKRDNPDFIDTDLNIHLHAYQAFDRTGDNDADTLTEAQLNANLERDIWRAIYATANLGVDGVIYAEVQQDSTSTGAPESVLEGKTELYQLVTVHYEESRT
jgi:hypothetical protein